MVGITIDGNRSTNPNNSGVLLSGVRFVYLSRVHAMRCGLYGFSAITDTTATSEMYFDGCFAGFNGADGFRLFGGDSTITGAMAGGNGGDGFYLGLAATACVGLSAWNNHRDGLTIASTTATQFLSVTGGQFYDNDRAGITVEAPGGNAMYGNLVSGVSCHGNGRQEYISYPSATDRVGVRVLGVHTPEMLAIRDIATGNRTYTLPATYQQYGVALQTVSCNPSVSGVSGINAIALWYLVDATAIPESQAGRLIPLKDNTFSIGRSSARWANFLGLRHTVYANANDAQPRAQLGTTGGGAELSFGAGGSSSPDWKMSRSSADTMALDAGDSLTVDGTWNGGTFRLGAYRLWVDSTGVFRMKNGAPSSDTDGTIVSFSGSYADLSNKPTTFLPAAHAAAHATGQADAIHPVDIGAEMDSNRLASGEENLSRDLISGSVPWTSQYLRLVYFTARKTETINSVRLVTAGVAAAPTPTLCRVGIYSVADNGDLTLVASTANDTSLFAAINTVYTKALTAPWSKQRGNRYAIGVLVVSSAACPSLIGQANGSATEWAVSPRISGLLGNLSDLPATVAGGAIGSTSGRQYIAMLP